LIEGYMLFRTRPAILQATVHFQENDVDKNRTEGAKNQAKGSMKEAASKVTGNKSGEIEGKLQKNLGKAQKAVGNAADESRSDARKTNH